MIQFCGSNCNFQLGEKSNSTSTEGNPAVSPPTSLNIDPYSILSLSIYNFHCVMIDKQNKLYGIGFNKNSEISRSLPKEVLKTFTEFSIKDNQNRLLTPISVVCGYNYTLYLVLNPENPSKYQLAYSFATNNPEYADFTLPIILNIGDSNPIALYGGIMHSAAINSDGSAIFINSDIISKSPTSLINSKFDLEGEKAIKIVCGYSEVFALSENGRVFKSSTKFERPTFSEVPELKKFKIIDISGTNDSFLAVSEDFKVFGYGSNLSGKLCYGKRTEYFNKFKKITPLKKFRVVSVYAGFDHSLFQTIDGRVLSCGDNRYGQLLLNEKPSEKKHDSPEETIVYKNAKSCIAGCKLSFVFIDVSLPNLANKVLK